MLIVKNGQTLIPVYLAGGFHSNWQWDVINSCEGLPFFFMNPQKGWSSQRNTEQQKEAFDLINRQSSWWHWDKLAIKIAEVIFVNCEDYKSVERGVGHIFEAGLGWAQDKIVIFVNEINHRYYRGIARNFLMFDNLQQGISCLKSGAWILQSKEEDELRCIQ